MIAAKRTLGVALILGASAFAPSIALADAPAAASAAPAPNARADALFKEGRALFDQKKYDEACPKLAESYDLDPGAGTLLALALCHEGQGKTATAWDELREAAAIGRKNGRPDLANAASKRATMMEPKLSKVAVKLPPAGADYEVKLDGDALKNEGLTTPFAVDPGEHKIHVSASQKASRIYVVNITTPGSTTDVVVEELQDAPRAVAAAPAKKPVSAADDVNDYTAPTEGEGDSNPGGVQRGIGLGLAGLGIVGLGAGAFFGAKAVGESSASGGANSEEAKQSARIGLASAAGGTIALGIGTILYFTAPRGAPTRGTAAPRARATARIVPDAGPTQLGLGVVGQF